MIFEKIKKHFLYIVVSVFLLFNLFVGIDFPFKKIISLSFLIIVILTCFYSPRSFNKIIRYFVYIGNDKITKKISGIASLTSWIFFVFSLFLINVGLVWFARWSILIFIICILISCVLIFFDLAREDSSVFIKLRFFFVSGLSVLYFITNAYSASYFMRMSNLDISDSPLLELVWKSAFFVLYLFMFLQPISYVIFLLLSNRFKGHRLITMLGVIFVASLLLAAIPRWAGNFMVVVLDWSISNEWRTSAMCGSMKISVPTEYYFGFNTDKYTVYFSNRDGNFGFEEINCIKDNKNQDASKRVLVSQSKIPKWFKE